MLLGEMSHSGSSGLNCLRQSVAEVKAVPDRWLRKKRKIILVKGKEIWTVRPEGLK